MSSSAFEFTLILSGIRELSREVLDALFESGCDDGVPGMRDGVAFVDFCRAAASFDQAVLSAIQDVEEAGIGARVEHIEPDELVTMSEIARRLDLSREGVRKWVTGARGPGNFPLPVGSLTRRSPLWRWTDILQWRQHELGANETKDVDTLIDLGSHIAVFNAALDLRRRVPSRQSWKILEPILAGKKRS